MSILPCDSDPRSLGLIVEGYWELKALREHVKECRPCRSVLRAFAAATGAEGGMAGRGDSKRRGDSDHYRRLALKSWRGE